MIYIYYALLCICVIFFSIKCAKYIDIIDKKANISGAFIGGVILAAVTSLPELFTSISAILIFNSPDLVLGNVLGSNIFNLAIMAILVFIATTKFAKSNINKSHQKVTLFIIAVYLVIGLTMFVANINVYGVSISSIIIIFLYVMSIKYMASDESQKEETETEKTGLKSAIIKFIIAAILLVIASILITYTTDIISNKLNLGASLAGALFLGIATSLPEVTSSFELVKLGNFNTAVGNIIGSIIFNFLIISISDVMYNQGSVYIQSKSSNYLMIFGLASSIAIISLLFIKQRNNNSLSQNKIYKFLSVISILCYILFLTFSV